MVIGSEKYTIQNLNILTSSFSQIAIIFFIKIIDS